MSKRDDPVKRARDRNVVEQARVARLLDRDKVARKRELKRATALDEFEQGVFVNLDDIAIPPPDEQRQRGYYVPFRGEKIGNTARAPMTVKNLAVDRPGQLFRRGVIDLDIYKAVAWYRRNWEMSGLSPSITSAYAERNTGERYYGHMPKSIIQIQARADYRWARDSIPADLVELFEAVVLHDRTLAEEGEASSEVASTATKFRNVKAAFIRAALIVFETIKGELEIED